MNISFTIVFIVLAILLAVFDFVIARKAYYSDGETGQHLGIAAFFAGVVTVSYFLSTVVKPPKLMSLFSSIYFLSIDWMLTALVRFVYRFTKFHLQKSAKIILFSVISYAVFDTFVLLANIFSGCVVEYVSKPSPVGELISYSYVMKPLYIMHLIFTYSLVIIVLTILIIKLIRTPHQYRNQYSFIIMAIAVVVAVNAAFLFLDNKSLIAQLDFSIFGYSLGLILCYWGAFSYRHKNMMESLSMTIFQNIGQGIVLFDHMNELVMNNRKAEQLLPDIHFEEGMTGDEFAGACSINLAGNRDRYTMHSDDRESSRKPLRVDYSRLKDVRGRTIGNLYVLTDETEETDPITGFPRVQAFRRYAFENMSSFEHPIAAAVVDIAGLGQINRVFGREVGDQRIRILARSLQRRLPKDTLYVRGHEAHLVAVCRGMHENELKEILEEIQKEDSGNIIFGISETIETGAASRNVLETIETASRSLQIKKLLSSKSFHSQTLTSLVRALQESDSDTEAHVKRTQKMGVELGRRIGLSDAQMADLQLLCLLHDIGKIGIPLEILNKPGKLTEQEWMVLRTHPEKGYQIAMSSEELKNIAPMILYHHERWDGRGYPEKLSGANIPILSRIISIVDSYDAMVNNRSYRTALTPEQAQEEIRRCAGSQFDPHLAEEFLRMLEDNPEIALGEKTGGSEVRVYIPGKVSPDVIGNTFAIPYSRYVLDLDDTIIEVDERFTDITGYSRDEVLGRMTQFDLIPTQDRGYYMLQVNNAFSHGNIAYLKHEIQRKDQTKIWVVCYGKRYYDSAEKAFRSEILIFRTTGGEAE